MKFAELNMEEATKPVSSANASSLGSVLRNPLVIFGLILLAGDGPLVVAYILTQDASRAWALLLATIVFIFCMGGFFCYLVAFKPRHLYAPTEIPEKAFGKSIYQDPEPVKRILKEAQSLAIDVSTTQNEGERQSITQNLANKLQLASQLQMAYDLLLIPGYDLSLISDILESCDRNGKVDPGSIADLRNITPSTVVTITDSMVFRGLLQSKGRSLKLTNQGQDLLSSLRIHLRPPAIAQKTLPN